MADENLGSAPVTDRRVQPRGVLPRGAQTWLMAALALGIIAIIVFTGQSTSSPTQPAGVPDRGAAPSPERLRDYQDRLRLLQQRNEALGAPEAMSPPTTPPRSLGSQSTPATDPVTDEQRRRDYTSLFAENIAWARPAAQMTLTPPTTPPAQTAQVTQPATTTLDHQPPTTTLHRVPEGTIVETVLTNRLDGSGTGPVNCLVTTPLYATNGQAILIPAGARVLGQTKPVQAFGESRLAVSFHRLLMPNGVTHDLNQLPAANQSGDIALRDRANQHYLAAFGAAAAIGLISGFSQALASAAAPAQSGNTAITISANGGESSAQTATQLLNRFLNRPPTVTIREGHRVVIYLTSDLMLPAYSAAPLAATNQ